MTAWARKHGGAIYLTVLVIAGFAGSYWLSVHNAASVTQLCQAGNESRAEQLGLWQYILGLSKHPQTPAQKQVTIKFERHIAYVFRPRDCHHITR